MAGTNSRLARLAPGGRAYRGEHRAKQGLFRASGDGAAQVKFAKETTNPRLAAVLIEKAADLKSQVDESSTTSDPIAQAPDAQREG